MPSSIQRCCQDPSFRVDIKRLCPGSTFPVWSESDSLGQEKKNPPTSESFRPDQISLLTNASRQTYFVLEENKTKWELSHFYLATHFLFFGLKRSFKKLGFEQWWWLKSKPGCFMTGRSWVQLLLLQVLFLSNLQFQIDETSRVYLG